MTSLFATPPAPPSRRLPGEVREAIRALKAEHPALNLREIATICYVRFGRRPSPQTTKRVLAERSTWHRCKTLSTVPPNPRSGHTAHRDYSVTCGRMECDKHRRVPRNEPPNRPFHPQALGRGRVSWPSEQIECAQAPGAESRLPGADSYPSRWSEPVDWCLACPCRLEANGHSAEPAYRGTPAGPQPDALQPASSAAQRPHEEGDALPCRLPPPVLDGRHPVRGAPIGRRQCLRHHHHGE